MERDGVHGACNFAENLPERRFAKATGFAPNAYVQQLRVAQAKKRLERTGKPIDEVSFALPLSFSG